MKNNSFTDKLFNIFKIYFPFIISIFLIIILILNYKDKIINLFNSDKNKTQISESANINFLVGALSNNEKELTSLYLFSYEPVTHRLGIIYFPKETFFMQINDNSKMNYQLLKNIYKNNGWESVIENIENKFKTDIKFYIGMTRKNFVKTIDLIGGLKMNITNQIKYYDKLNDKYYLIPSGIHLLFGEKILEYLEFNQDVFNDINIVYRKNNFIKEVFKYLNANYDKFDSQKNFVKIFYSFINQTNIDFNSFFEIFLDLTEVKTYDILFDKVPGQIELKNDVKGINISVTQAMNILPKNFKTRYSSSPKDNYITVEILNSTSASGLAEKVRQKIQFFADIDVLYTGNANERGLKNTVIKYHNNLRSAQRIKELLGVGKIVRDIDKNSFFDITIILADDIDTEKIKKIED